MGGGDERANNEANDFFGEEGGGTGLVQLIPLSIMGTITPHVKSGGCSSQGGAKRQKTKVGVPFRTFEGEGQAISGMLQAFFWKEFEIPPPSKEIF